MEAVDKVMTPSGIYLIIFYHWIMKAKDKVMTPAGTSLITSNSVGNYSFHSCGRLPVHNVSPSGHSHCERISCSQAKVVDIRF